MTNRTGRVVLGRMNEVVFGRPAAAAVAELASQSGARRVLIMASGTLNRETDVVEQVRQALADRVAATFDQVPAHSPRDAVIVAVELARDIDADLIVTIGGGSVTDAGKAVPFCLANNIRTAEDLDA
ncbi:MAG: iron-containing alcohol dehydrogenase, partial [Burkholderiaceae bacterium]